MNRIPRRLSGTSERPLTPAARGSLVLAATVTMLLFYAAALLMIVVLVLLLLALTLVLLGAARFGFSRFITPMMEPPSSILSILVRQLWLPAPVEYRIPLVQADAPRFFTMVGNVARRLGVRPPTAVVVEMHAGAWVNLRGFRRSAGKSTLGIGFDLLAGLSAPEIEAVLAHELAHARLVQRGFSRWLNKGLARLANVSRRLGAYHVAGVSADKRSDLAKWANRLFDGLTARAARLVATYSRQDEFDADRTAAELCGTPALRSALLKLEALDAATARLPWNERVARLQGGNFSQWFVAALAALVERVDQEPARHAADPYSTHPTLRDRVAALPADDRSVAPGSIGLDLLAKPDAVAERLASEIQRVAAAQEAAHSKTLARDTRKFCRRTGSHTWELLGFGAIAFGALIAVMFVFPPENFDADAAWTAAGSVVVGLALLSGRRRHRDRRKLPVPAFGSLSPETSFPNQEALVAAETALVEEYERKGERFDLLLSACYKALEQRDYLRAHVTARLALKIKAKSVEARLGYAIAAASLGNDQQAHGAIATIRQQRGITTPNTRWGIAWALVMLRDWGVEGLLERLHRDEPQLATYAALLAWAQLSRGKVHSAIRNAKTASRLSPSNDACRQLVVDALVAAGNAREASRVAQVREGAARPDAHGALQMVRLRLMLQDTAGAEKWARTLCDIAKEGDSKGDWLVALGAEFSRARLDDMAQTFYAEALATPYHVQANIGLAGLAQGAGEREKARQHLLAALKLENARLVGDETRGYLFHNVIGRLVALEERRIQCHAWVGAIPENSPSLLAGARLLVYAPDLAGARAHLGEITAAMQTNELSFDQSSVNWQDAPTEHQPLRPVAPGVQFVLSG